MDSDRLSPNLQSALSALLDDSAPAVHKALLTHFLERPAAATHFLKELAAGNNRMLAWHARRFLEELKFSDPVAEFKGFIRSLSYELETGALLLGRTVYPSIDVGACCEQLDQIAGRCRELIAEPMTVREKCRIVNRVLFHEYGFRGNLEHYTDPLNSFLHEVLVRRKGIPISLSIVYLLIGHRLALDLEPVALPGHFVVGCYVEDRPFFIDPFEQGAFRTADDIVHWLRARKMTPKVADLAPTPVREVLCRCCRNLSSHYQEANDEARARLFADFVDEFESTHESQMQP